MGGAPARLPLSLGEILALAARLAGETPPQTDPPEAASVQITGFAALEDAGPGDLSFFSNPKYLRAAERTAAAAVLVPLDFAGSLPCPVVRHANPSLAFAFIAEALSPPPPAPEPGVHPSAVVEPGAAVDPAASVGPLAVISSGAVIGPGTVIGAGCFIGSGSRVGAGCFLHPGVKIREGCVLGDRVILHCGCVVGADGFGYEFKDGRHVKIRQAGGVIIGNDVEIGANTTIDRARFGNTRIGDGTKIDNLVQIAHNVVIGRGCIIVAGAMIAGSTRLGDYVTLGGQVGVAGHLTIGDRVMAGAQSGISKSIPAGTVVFGSPAEPMREAKRKLGYLGLLGGLFDRVKAIEEKLGLR